MVRGNIRWVLVANGIFSALTDGRSVVFVRLLLRTFLSLCCVVSGL